LKSTVEMPTASRCKQLCAQLQISLVVWMFQYPPRTAAAVGLSMAQIGEFAFVLLSSASQHGLLAYQVYMLLMGAFQGLVIPSYH
jgi:predicted Kef-type K+ transport protein